MGEVTLYHNPKCSKSRGAKEILDARGVEYRIVEYLQDPPDRKTLEQLIADSAEDPGAFVRSSDSAFKETDLSVPSDTAGVASFLAANPAFLQRPVLRIRGKVVIGRPTDRVSKALDEAGL